MQSAPYWIAFGDIHDDVSPIADIPGLSEAAGVIITGDITVVGGVRQAERVLSVIAARNPAIHAQIGNMDKAEVTDWLDGRGWNIHRAARELAPGVGLLGAGYSTPPLRHAQRGAGSATGRMAGRAAGRGWPLAPAGAGCAYPA